MRIIDKIAECIECKKEPERGQILEHTGFTSGAHGKPLSKADKFTQDYVSKLKEAADSTGYIVHRISLGKTPLKTVFIGRDYALNNFRAHKLTDLLVTSSDLLLCEQEMRTRDLQERFKGIVKDIKFNGIRSGLTTSKEDYEIYGPLNGTNCEKNQYIAAPLINFTKSDEFSRIYQHCLTSRAEIGKGMRDKATNKPIYEKTLVSEVENAGLSYAVLMPREVEESFQKIYEVVTKHSASKRLTDPEKAI